MRARRTPTVATVGRSSPTTRRRGPRLVVLGAGVAALSVLLPAAATAAPTAAVSATVIPGTPAAWMRPAQTRIVVENLGDAATAGPTTVSVQNGAGADGRLEGVGWSCGPLEGPYRVGECVRDAPLGPGERAPDIRLVATTDDTNNSAAIGGTTRTSASVRTPVDGRAGGSYADRPVVRDSAADATLGVEAGLPAPRSAPRTWTVRVTNRGTASTGAPLRVELGSDGAPPAASGDGWLCEQSSRTCLLLTPLAPFAAAPDLDVRSVAGDPSTTLRGRVVDPGRAPGATDQNDAGSATAVLVADDGPDLAAAVGPAPGSRNALAVDVRNAGDRPTAGPITVSLTRADGSSSEVGVATGEGWDCASRFGSCTTSTVVAPGDALPSITVRFRAPGAGGAPYASTRATVSVASDARPANDTASGGRTTQPEDGSGLDLDLRAPAAPVAGTDVVSTVLVRNPGPFATDGTVDVALGVPAGSTAGGPGWICTRELRCRLDAPIGAGGSAPELGVRSPLPASPAAGPVSFGATLTSAGAGISVTGEATTGARAGDVTVGFGPHAGLARAGDTTVVPVLVRTTGAMPVTGVTVVRLETGLPGRASGAGWSCGPEIRGARRCTHAGPLAAGAGLPQLSWELTAPDPLPGPVAAATPVGGIRATVVPPSGSDVDTGDNVATATPLAPAPNASVVDLVGTWDDLVPATAERAGRASFAVTNTTGAEIPGTVSVDTSGWRGESGQGWRCTDRCRYAGPVPAGATLPPIRGAIEPAHRSDDADFILANLYRPDGTQVDQYQASVPASRGPVPSLSLFFIGTTTVQPGASTTLYGLIDADRPVPGPAELRLTPDPGLVVERVSGGTCTTALRCRLSGPFGDRREIAVVVRSATDAAGPLRLHSRLSADGARPSDRDTTLVLRAAGGDLTSSIDGPSAVLPEGEGRVVLRVRNDGPEAIEGPIRSQTSVPGSRADLQGASANGWSCERFSGTCVHDGPLLPGASLPPLMQTATAGGIGAGGPRIVSSGTAALSGDDSVTENSGASTTVPVGAPAAADVAISLAPREAPRLGGPATFEARVRNVGDRTTTAPVEVAFGTTLVLAGGMVVPVPALGGSVTFPDVASDGGSGWECDVATQRCLLPAPLAPGEAAPVLPVRRTLLLLGAAPGVETQTASVTSGSDANRSTAATASVGPSAPTAADVAVAVGTESPTMRGRTIRHTVRVANLGTARSVEPVEVEVAGVRGQRVALSGPGWICPAGGRTCRLAQDGLAAGEAAPALTAELAENGSYPDDRGVTATVTGDGAPQPVGNDRATSSVLQPVGTQDAEIGLAFDDLSPTPPGDTVHGRLRVAHVGSGTPAGPVVVVLGGVDGAGGDGWTCDTGTSVRERRCATAEPPAQGGQLPPIDVESRAPVDRWVATVVSPAPGRYAAAAVVPSVGRPPVDVGVTLTGGAPLRDGDETVLVATARNAGLAATTAPTTIALSAPSNVSLEPEGSGWACDDQTCTTRSEVAPGERFPDLRVHVRPQGRDGARAASIAATVTHPGDGVPVDDTSTATVGVGAGRVDLAVSLSSDDALRAGRTTRTMVRVRNVGAGGTDRPTTLDVVAPFGGTLSGDGWACEELRCRRTAPVPPETDLPPVVLAATTPTDAPLVGTATSATVSNADDGTSTDDRVVSTRGVGVPDRTLPRPSTAVAVGLPVTTGSPGDLVPVQVAVLGPDAPRDTPARVRATLPPGLSFAGVPEGDPAPTRDGRSLTWDRSLLADGAADAWTVNARVDDDAAPGARRLTGSLEAAPFASPESATATFVVTSRPEEPSTGGGTDPPPASGAGPRAPGRPPRRSRTSRLPSRRSWPVPPGRRRSRLRRRGRPVRAARPRRPSASRPSGRRARRRWPAPVGASACARPVPPKPAPRSSSTVPLLDGCTCAPARSWPQGGSRSDEPEPPPWCSGCRVRSATGCVASRASPGRSRSSPAPRRAAPPRAAG